MSCTSQSRRILVAVAVAPHSSGVLERDDTTIAASVRVSVDAFVVGAGSAGGGECPVWGGARST